MADVIPTGTRAVFFDAVGTVLFPDPPAPTVYAEVARRHGLDFASSEVRARFVAAFQHHEQLDRENGWATSEQREQDRWRAIVAATLHELPDTEACFHELFEHFSKPSAWRLGPDVADVLAKLTTRGFVLGLGSNYDGRLWPVLDGFPELALLRERVVVSAAMGYRKPAAEFFREVVRIAGCEPGEVLFVGDDLGNDYEGATAAGLPVILLDEQNRYPHISKRIIRLAELVE